MEDTIKVTGTVHATIRDNAGNVKFDCDLGKNVITNLGKAAMAGLVGNTGAITAFSYIAVGTSGTAETAADTTLGAEITDTGLTRAASSVSRVTTTQTNDTLQFSITFTATGTKANIQEIGIFNAVSSGTMLARKTFSILNVSNTDTLTFTYKVQFT